MPSLVDLFKSKVLNSGNIASEEYDIRNSKDIKITTSNTILNTTVFPIVQKTLRNSKSLTNRTRETLLEEESVGIRAISKLSSPLIYGTDVIKFESQKSQQTVTLKYYANSQLPLSDRLGDSGLIGNIVNTLKTKVNTTLAKIGIKFPTDLIPSKVAYENSALGMGVKGNQPDTMIILSKIKGEGEGSILGKFLQQNAKGTPNQIGRQLIGGIVQGVKDKVKQKLFGTLGNVATNPILASANQTVLLRNDDVLYGSGDEYGKYKKYTYQLKKYNSSNEISESTDLARLLYSIQSGEQSEFVKTKNSNDLKNFANPKNTDVFPSPYPEFSLESITQNIPGRVKKKYSNSDILSDYKIDKDGVSKFNTKKDLINMSKPWYSEDGTIPVEGNGKTLDDYDFIPLKFYSVAKKTGVSFKATISGLGESISPSWDTGKFIGNPYSFYTYSGVERSVSFNFKIFSLSGDEHISAWQKLNFLVGLAYPQDSNVDIYTTPPIIKFTLGNMYKNKVAIIDSLAINIDDTTPWEIGLNPTIADNVRVSNIENNTNLSNYKLPTIIDVQIGIKFIETASEIAGNRLYYYGDSKFDDERNAGIEKDGRVLKNKPKLDRSADNSIGIDRLNQLDSRSLGDTFLNNITKDDVKGRVTNKIKIKR